MLCQTLFSLTRRCWWECNAQGRFSCSDLKMVEFKILRAVRRAYKKLTTLNFKRADLFLFRELLGRIPWRKALKVRGAVLYSRKKPVCVQGSPSLSDAS